MSIIEMYTCGNTVPDSKAYGANMEPQVGPMLAPWTLISGVNCEQKNNIIQFLDYEAQ